MNTYTLVKISESNFILCDTEPVKEYFNGYIYAPKNGVLMEEVGKCHAGIKDTIRIFGRKFYKVVASLYPMEGLPTITSAEVVAKEIGYVDMEELATKNWRIVLEEYISTPKTHIDSFTQGYLQALEDNKERRYTESDIRIAIDMARGFTFDQHWNKYENHKTDEIISSLHKTSWKVEIEMEHYSKPEDGHSAVHKDTRPKVTNNTIHITKIIE